MRIGSRYLATAALLSAFASSTVIAETAEEVMAIVDATFTSVEDQSYDGAVEVFRDGNRIKSFTFTAKLKGMKAKLIRFTSGDAKGMAVLTTESGTMYVYLPSYQKVRRVASHVNNQGFMGTDISPEDVGGATLSLDWDAVVDREDETSWYLTLKPKPSKESAYAKMKLVVSKKYGGVSRLEGYNASGKLVKSQDRSEWKKFGPTYVPTHFIITNHLTGSKTIMTFNDCKVNQGIPSSAFTKRAIQREG